MFKRNWTLLRYRRKLFEAIQSIGIVMAIVTGLVLLTVISFIAIEKWLSLF
ncbi:hypothetical protein [Serratia ureilytica]|uniref:hypothetical protein n=1 Tax=Serratia ureilytica TaxID=300181 RepID=UPI0019CF9350|nr:hypothetical protein [Serratia ureilytica]MBN5281805.1 hypothetical protein [Serratia ureilytica]MBN5372910.1 hypothetical protein [Serratia ureilytica]